MIQTLITALLVAVAALYAAWSLMPATWRMALARRLLRWAPRNAWLQKAAQSPGGCASGDGCQGCDDGAGKQPAPGTPKVIQIHRRRQG
jgi:hypothetical protein